MSDTKTVFLDEAEWLEFHPIIRSPTTGDEHLAALVGYMIGDGTIAKRAAKYVKKNGEISTYAPRMNGAFYSNDKSDLEEIRHSLNSLGMALATNVTPKKASAEHLKNGFQIQIGNRECEILVDAGVPCGKKTEMTFDVPKWILLSEKNVKRAFIAALFGAEGSSPAINKRGSRIARPIVMTMHKIDPTPAEDFFLNVQKMLAELGVESTITTTRQNRFEKDYIEHSVRISGLDNLIAFFENVGYFYCDKRATAAWKWLQYLKAYRFAAQLRRKTVEEMTANGKTISEIGRSIGLTKGAAARLRSNILNGRSTTSGHAFPQFNEWIKERWDDDRKLLRLKVTSKKKREEKTPVWNLLVGSHDHSYLLANGANNFNSFETMSGRVYYPFDRAEHVGNYNFNPALPIWVGVDFNIDPMSAVIFQPQPNGELWAVDEIVRFGSNTDEICEELDKRFWRYQSSITIYPDPAGGQRQHARGETDLDIFRQRGFKKIKHRRKHPLIADRVNAVNRMLRAADGIVRMKIDSKCKHLITAFEQTIYKPGSRDVDKDAGVEHSADAAGYCIDLEYPVRKVQIGGASF